MDKLTQDLTKLSTDKKRVTGVQAGQAQSRIQNSGYSKSDKAMFAMK